ncbi:MAG: hypothetical protein RL885_00465 [Planctomycetota bacterium]
MSASSPSLALRLSASVFVLAALLVLFTPSYREVAWVEARTHLPIGGELEVHDALHDPSLGEFSALRPDALFEILADDGSDLEERIGAATLLGLRYRPLGKNLGREELGALVAYLLDTIERFPEDPIPCLQLYEATKVHRLGEQLLDRTSTRSDLRNASARNVDAVALASARRALERGLERDPENGTFEFELGYLALASGDLAGGLEHVAAAGRSELVTRYLTRRLQAAHELLESHGLPAPESMEFVQAAAHRTSPSLRRAVEISSELARASFESGDSTALGTMADVIDFTTKLFGHAHTLFEARLGLEVRSRALAQFVDPESTLDDQQRLDRFASLLEDSGESSRADRFRDRAEAPRRFQEQWREFLKTTAPPPSGARLLTAAHGYLLIMLIECLLLYGIGCWLRGDSEARSPLRRPLAAFGVIVLSTGAVMLLHQLIANPMIHGSHLNRGLIDTLVLGAPFMLAGLIVTWRRPGTSRASWEARAAAVARVFGIAAFLLVVIYAVTFPIAVEQRKQIADEHQQLLTREASFVRGIGS